MIWPPGVSVWDAIINVEDGSAVMVELSIVIAAEVETTGSAETSEG